MSFQFSINQTGKILMLKHYLHSNASTAYNYYDYSNYYKSYFNKNKYNTFVSYEDKGRMLERDLGEE